MNFTFRQPYNSLKVFWTIYGSETAMDSNMYLLVSKKNKINKQTESLSRFMSRLSAMKGLGNRVFSNSPREN